MAGLLPSATVQKMFAKGYDFSYNVASGVDKAINLTEIGLWIISIRFYGNNVEHMSSYLFSQAGVYAKKLTKLSEYNYNSNSSVLVSESNDGNAGFVIKATYSNLSGNIFVTAKRLV